jgi:hypothetical protein
MGTLLHPVGAQPKWVYWARRAVLVVVLAAVVGVGFLLFRPTDDPTVAAVPAGPSSSAVSQPASSTPSATQSSSPTPTGPVACDKTNSGLSLAAYKKVKQDAKQPFRLAVTNTGSGECILDLTATNFSLTVTSGTDRIWTTDDCAKWVPAKKQTLKPQKAYEFAVEWGVVRSGSGCKEAKSLLKPGTYVATGVFAETVKSRQVFLITKAGKG